MWLFEPPLWQLHKRLLPGIEPQTFWSKSRRANLSAILLPKVCVYIYLFSLKLIVCVCVCVWLCVVVCVLATEEDSWLSREKGRCKGVYKILLGAYENQALIYF